MVPTGNLAIYCGLLCQEDGASIAAYLRVNDNKVLYDFFTTGIYDRNRQFILTISPSMDILISSNLERLIYHIAGDDSDKTGQLMAELSATGRYEITPDMRSRLDSFIGGYATVSETMEAIRRVYAETGYVIDTHTAVAVSVYEKYAKSTAGARKAM